MALEMFSKLRDGSARLRSLSRRAFVAGAALALVAAFLPQGSGLRADERGDGASRQWVGTWTTSPRTTTATPLQFPAQTTVREIVRTSVAGSVIRVRLSNEFGTTPLVIGAAHVARRASGSTIVSGTDRALTFSGQTTITIPPGAPVVSDPVRLNVPALSDLAVSLYLPNDTSGATYHPTGLQTNYIAPAGADYTGADALPAGTTTLSWYFLSGVEVVSKPDAATVVTLGDSITDGTRSTPDTNSRWPNVLAGRLQARHGLDDLGVLNQGISGNRLLSDSAGVSALARFDRDVLSQPGVEYIILLEGINDIGNSARGTGPLVTANDVIAAQRQIIARARGKGIRIYGATLTPIAGSGYDFPIAEQDRQAVNDWIRTGGEFDAVIDFDLVTRDPSQPSRFLPAFDSGDHLHPNDDGYRMMGEAIPLRLFQGAGQGVSHDR